MNFLKKISSFIGTKSEENSELRIAKVAHDLRSPLAVLKIMLKDEKSLPLPKLNLMQEAVNQMNALVENILLDFNARKITPEAIAQLLKEVIVVKKLQYQDRFLDLNLKIELQAYNLKAMINRVKFKCLIENLVDNAVESCEKISDCRRGEVNIILVKAEQELLIKIQDNGVGMPEEMQQKIFKQELISGKINGHGLGLMSAISLVEKEFGGKLLIKSGKDQGTEIRIELNFCGDRE